MSLNITFKVSGGSQFNLPIDPKWTILQVKEAVGKEASTPHDVMKIIYKGRILKNEDSVESQNVEDGHSMHVIKGVSAAKPAEPTPAPAAPVPAPTPAPITTPVAPPAAAFPRMGGGAPGGGAFPSMAAVGGGGGDDDPMMGGMDQAQLMEHLNNPQIRAMMEAVAQNPEMLQQMMMQDPQMMGQLLQLLQASGGLGGMGGMGGIPDIPDDGRTPEERWAEQLVQLEGMGFSDKPSNLQALQMAGGDVDGAVNFILGGGQAANPLEQMMQDPNMMAQAQQMMQDAEGMDTGMAGMEGVEGMEGIVAGGPPAADDGRPLEERWASELEQLNNMGFSDKPSNLQALQLSEGDVNAAINLLLGGM